MPAGPHGKGSQTERVLLPVSPNSLLYLYKWVTNFIKIIKQS